MLEILMEDQHFVGMPSQIFFFKQKTAYEMRISDWSSDVCSSDLTNPRWKNVKRNYSAADVVRLRGSLNVEHTLAKRGAEKLWKLVNGEAKKGSVTAFGAITAGHALQQAKAGIQVVYLSGWQVSAAGTSRATMQSAQTDDAI